jgi:hypothetical protein
VGLAWTPLLTARARFERIVCISSSGKNNQVEGRTLEIEFLDPGVQAFSFKFG